MNSQESRINRCRFCFGSFSAALLCSARLSPRFFLLLLGLCAGYLADMEWYAKVWSENAPGLPAASVFFPFPLPAFFPRFSLAGWTTDDGCWMLAAGGACFSKIALPPARTLYGS
jgi:hypothetical protein